MFARMVKASKKCLTAKGYEVLSINDDVITALKDDAVVFVKIKVSENEFSNEPVMSRDDYESLILTFAMENPESVGNIFQLDEMQFAIIGPERAVARHHINVQI